MNIKFLTKDGESVTENFALVISTIDDVIEMTDFSDRQIV